ncbi:MULTISPECIES: SpoIIE family protein phosphatase [Nocardiopsis]|uniref:PAS domain S-box-containing protein n=1 Tax=Nocardiopsis sinuspersici TaxID=501010 RepID=A0A1V3C2H8_9ACTN|nr:MULTISPECIES: SpoIIE family protein phosphatase [Nocardiopsis]NYH50843.1 PAS domain S-box-containing protein [Nocardiopsis sinuspersici]OOC54669.1 peptidylprolyl isomerase [Nocardiopsis sinuspersici]
MNGKRAAGDGSEGALAEAFSHAPEPMALALADGAVLHANLAFTELFGLEEADLVGRTWYDLLDGDDAQRGARAHDEALAGHWGRRARLRLSVSDKAAHLVEAELRPLPGKEAGGTHVVALLHVLSTEETDLRVIGELRTDNSDSVLWSLDLGTGRLRELFGPTPLGALLAGNDRELERILERVHPDDIARVRDAMSASFAGRDYEQRFRVFDRLGDERSLHVRARYVPGEPDRLVGIVDDVTEHVQLVRRLADRRRTEAEHGRLVTELSSKLVSATTVDKVMDLLSEEFLPIFGGVQAIALYVENGLLRSSPNAHGRGGAVNNINSIDGRRADDTDFPMGAVIQDRQPRFFESRAEIISRFPAAVELMRQVRGQAWATVPIFGDGKVALGVWQMVWDRPHHASRDERALMLTFAGLAGQALQRIKAQQAELELADAVQRRMLPRQVASFPDMDIATKYLPSRADWRICGDFYDVIELPESKVGLLVGDVQGHGVEAAAAMGQIRVAFRAYASNQSDPGVVLGETNRLLTETGEIVFATCGYLVVDRESGVMQAAWAGQPPAVLASKGGYEIWEPETGPPLGVLPSAEYPVTTRMLPPGTSLLLCSDGLVESSQIPMGEGLAQVGAALAEHSESPEDAADVLAEMAPAGRGDDIALLVTRMVSSADLARSRAAVASGT